MADCANTRTEYDANIHIIFNFQHLLKKLGNLATLITNHMQTPSFEPLELLTEDDYPSQFDYITKAWNAIADCGDNITCQFIQRYVHNHVSKTDRLQDYVDDEMVQTVLNVYGLDPEKFWYLLIMAKDFTEGSGTDILFEEVPIEQLNQMFSLIGDNLVEHKMAPMGYDFDYDPKMTLTLSVKKPGMKRNTKVTVDTANAFAFLLYAFEDKVKTKYPAFMSQARARRFGQMGQLTMTEKLACFTKILYPFLRPLNATPGIAPRTIPTDKYYLVSRCAYLLGITKDKRFINTSSPRYLKDYIKDCESFNIMGLNRFYSFDFFDYPY